MTNTLVVSNSTSLVATDVAVAVGRLTLPGCPSVKYSLVEFSNGVEKPLVEVAEVKAYTITVGNSTVYTLTATQPVGTTGQILTNYVSYLSPSTGATAASICAALVETFNYQATAIGMGVVASNDGSNNLKLTASAGTPLFNVSGVNSNLTLRTGTNDPMYLAPNATPGTALAGTTTVTVTTASAHGLATGSTVYVSGWTGPALTYQGATASSSAGIVCRITYTGASTFTLDGVTSDGVANTGTLVILKVAQAGMGTPDAVNAALTADGQTASANSLYNYARIAIRYGVAGNATINNGVSNNILTFYFPASNVASTYTAQNAFFLTAAINALNGVTTGTTANAEIISVNSNLAQ